MNEVTKCISLYTCTCIISGHEYALYRITPGVIRDLCLAGDTNY